MMAKNNLPSFELDSKDWKFNLMNRFELVGTEKLRHAVPYVKASDIGSQFFCELKVDMDYTQGRVETKSMMDGTQIHDEVLKMKKADIETIIENIESGGIFIAVFSLIAKHDGLVFCGRPDAIVFKGGKPVFVIELKTAKNYIDRIFDSQLAQTDI